MIESKLILVEGIPGTGKTTTAKKIKEELTGQGKKVNLYEEGVSHPADMSWNAYLTEEEYAHFLKNCQDFWSKGDSDITWEEVKKGIDSQARHEKEHVILAYTRITFPKEDYWSLIGEVASKELCDGRSSLGEFREIHLKRWSAFAKEMADKEEVTIFECAFLQNHIFELLGTYEKSDMEIIEYLLELLECVKILKPSLVYIKPDSVEKVIKGVAKERKAPNEFRRDWIDEIISWVENTSYGKHHNLIGQEGVIAFCKERLRLDELVISKLDIPVTWINRI